MDNTEQDIPKKELPFNNLFLNAGVVHGLNFWWMYAAGIFAAFLGYVICQLIITFPLMALAFEKGFSISDIQQDGMLLFDADRIGIDKNILLAMLLSMFAFALFGLYIVVKRIHRKPFLSIVTAYNKLRYDRLFFGFAVWSTLIVVLTAASYFLFPGEMTLQFQPKNFIFLFIVTLFIMPVQTSTEEILIRGYLLQGISQLTKNGIVPIIITSLFFGLLHMQNPEAKEFGWYVMLPYYTVFGAFLAVVTLVDEGLELALGIHFANNFISSLLITTPNGALKTDAIFSTKMEDPGQEFILFLIMASITFFIFWLKYRWTNFKLILK